jgi:hypothetical protein
MSPLERSAQHTQNCLAAAAASIATDQNQLTAAVCSARIHVQSAAKKLQDARSAYAKVAVSAAAAPNSNIFDCASAARAQRDDLLLLAGQLQELAEFMRVTFVFRFLSTFRLCVAHNLSCARFSNRLLQAAAAHDSRFLVEVPPFPVSSASVASQLTLKPKAATFCLSSGEVAVPAATIFNGS